MSYGNESATFGPDLDAWPWSLHTTAWTPVTNGTPAICIDLTSVEYSLQVSVLVLAAVIIVLLNVLLHRCGRGCSPQSLLDLIVPVKFLDATPFRFIYCVVMSAWAAVVFISVSDSRQFFRNNGVILDAIDVFVFSPAVIILKQTLTFFPILACVDSPVPVIGHAIGFLYTLLVASHDVYLEYMTLTGCSPRGHLTTRDMIFSVAVSAPLYVNYLITAGWFFFHTALEVPLVLCTHQKCAKNIPEYNQNKCYYSHVKGLFQGRSHVKRKVIDINTLYNYLKCGLAFILPYHPGFNYPLSLLSAISMAMVLIYQLGLSWSYAAVQYTEDLMAYVREFNITVETVERFFPKLKPHVDQLFYDAKSLVLAFNILLPLCAFISFTLTIIFTVYMVQHYHKLLKRASRGDLSFLVVSESLPSIPYRLAAMMRYSAFQMSYIVFSWFSYFLVMTVLFTFGLLFYFLFKNFQSFGVHLWSWFMIPMAWGVLMHQVQLFLCYFVFLEDKHQSEDGRFVPIRFKSLYQVLSFILFFFNAIYGLVMCLLRVAGTFIFTVVMLLRMDWDVYMRGLEGWDVGCRTFVGYMYIECTNNNPVVRTFIGLLRESISHNQTSTLEEVSDSSENFLEGTESSINIVQDANPVAGNETEGDQTLFVPRSTRQHGNLHKEKNGGKLIRWPKSKRAQNRWLVAYTLLRNPSLLAFTASNLDSARRDELPPNGVDYNYGTFYN